MEFRREKFKEIPVVPSIRCRLVPCLAGVLTAGLVAMFSVSAGAEDARNAAKTGNLVPGPELVRSLEASVKFMQSATRSASEFNQKAKALENEAYAFAILVQAGRDTEEMARKAGPLTETALALAAAAKKKNYNDAKNHVAALADFKKVESDGTTVEVNFGKSVPLRNLMEVVRDTDQELKKATRLTAASWNQRGKAEEITNYANRMTALSLAMLHHTPETDPDAKKGQTAKVWRDTSQETMDACLELAKAARSKNANEFKKAYTAMDKACTRCHDVYRVEED